MTAPSRRAAAAALPAVPAHSSEAAPWIFQVPGWPARRARPARLVGVIDGEGIGPEVVAAARTVLDAVLEASGVALAAREIDCDAVAERAGLTARTAELCAGVFEEGGVLFCGAVGGRFVYDLRARFDLYCKVVPLSPSPVLADAAIVRPERLAGVDVLLVRENVGGLYMGEFGRRDTGRVAYQHFSYDDRQVERIVRAAVRLARERRGRLTAVIKSGGVPEVSGLWREVTERVTAATGIDVEVLEVDNAGFQLVADPHRFDVVVAPNLFGDVLADAATVLLASRGMSYSANFGDDGRAAYQTGHGAAHDLTGTGRANPVGQILSLALMLSASCDLPRQAAWITSAVDSVLARGIRTADVAGPSARIAGTREMAAEIAAEVSRAAARERSEP